LVKFQFNLDHNLSLSETNYTMTVDDQLYFHKISEILILKALLVTITHKTHTHIMLKLIFLNKIYKFQRNWIKNNLPCNFAMY